MELKEQKNIMEFGKGGRDHAVDVLRCFSCWMVITGHAINMIALGHHGAPHVEIGSATWNGLAIEKAIVISATTLFVMVSGIFFLSPHRTVTPKKIWSKNIIKLTCAYVFWCWAYQAYGLISQGEALSVVEILGGVFHQPRHLWYIPMLIGLYTIAPFVRLITKQADEKLYKYGIIILVAALVFNTYSYFGELPYYKQVEHLISKTPTEEVARYVAIFIFGYYLYSYRPSDRTRHYLYLIGILCIAISSCFCIYAASETNPFAPWDKYFFAKLTITTFGKNTAIFLFIVTVFRKVNFAGIGKALLTKMSNCTLIIYLIHVIFLRITFKTGFLYDWGINPVIAVIIHSTIVFLMGFAVAYVFQLIPWKKLWRKPFVRKQSE